MPVDVTPHFHEDVTYHFLGLVLVVQDAIREAKNPWCERVV